MDRRTKTTNTIITVSSRNINKMHYAIFSLQVLPLLLSSPLINGFDLSRKNKYVAKNFMISERTKEIFRTLDNNVVAGGRNYVVEISMFSIQITCIK